MVPLKMLTLYMCFNGTIIWGGETLTAQISFRRHWAGDVFSTSSRASVTALQVDLV